MLWRRSLMWSAVPMNPVPCSDPRKCGELSPRVPLIHCFNGRAIEDDLVVGTHWLQTCKAREWTSLLGRLPLLLGRLQHLLQLQVFDPLLRKCIVDGGLANIGLVYMVSHETTGTDGPIFLTCSPLYCLLIDLNRSTDALDGARIRLMMFLHSSTVTRWEAMLRFRTTQRLRFVLTEGFWTNLGAGARDQCQQMLTILETSIFFCSKCAKTPDQLCQMPLQCFVICMWKSLIKHGFLMGCTSTREKRSDRFHFQCRVKVCHFQVIALSVLWLS